MKKIVKRIAAMGAAVMMMSSMAIGASAYTLRFTSGAPSSAAPRQTMLAGALSEIYSMRHFYPVRT